MTDRQLLLDILDELDFEPGLDAADLVVAVEDGLATLSGLVRNYGEKAVAIEIVETVKGVRAITDAIEVRPEGADVAADDEIARHITNRLRWSSSVSEEGIRVTVSQGRVMLSGAVAWHYQAEAAVGMVRRMRGVTGIANRIEVTPAVTAADMSDRIRKALSRDAELDAGRIRVRVERGTVTLEGNVRSLGERRVAERTAWSAPGVTQVVDRLTVL